MLVKNFLLKLVHDVAYSVVLDEAALGAGQLPGLNTVRKVY